MLKKFEKNIGLYGKTQILKSRFGLEISAEYQAIVSSLKDIRNCFAHSNGFVRQADGKDDGALRKFYWKTIHVFLKGVESGKESRIEFNKSLEEACHVCMQIKEHCKSFKIGEQMTFSSSEVYEIAMSLQFVAREYFKEIKEKLLKDL